MRRLESREKMQEELDLEGCFRELKEKSGFVGEIDSLVEDSIREMKETT